MQTHTLCIHFHNRNLFCLCKPPKLSHLIFHNASVCLIILLRLPNLVNTDNRFITSLPCAVKLELINMETLLRIWQFCIKCMHNRFRSQNMNPFHYESKAFRSTPLAYLQNPMLKPLTTIIVVDSVKSKPFTKMSRGFFFIAPKASVAFM